MVGCKIKMNMQNLSPNQMHDNFTGSNKVHMNVLEEVGIIEQIVPKIKRTTKRKKKKPCTRCMICKKNFSTPGSLKIHMKSYHNNLDLNECEIKMNEQATKNILQPNDSSITPLDQQFDNSTESNNIHMNSYLDKSASNECEIEMNEPATRNILQPNDSSITPLDQQFDNSTESNNIHMNVFEKVNKIKSIPKKSTTKRKKKKPCTYCSICRKNFSTSGSCKTHMKSYHGDLDSNVYEIKTNELIEKSLNHSIEPNNTFEKVSVNENVPRKEKKQKKKNPSTYCNICKKYFSTTRTYKIHMSNYHDNLVPNECAVKKSDKKYLPPFKSIEKINEDLWVKNAEEFENEMPLEFWYANEKYRCNVCNVITTNLADFMDHEKIHYQNIAEENYDVIGKIVCNTCQCVFTALDYDEHKHVDCKAPDYKISISQSTEPNAQIEPIIKNEENDLPPDSNDSKIIILAKDSGVLAEDHIKVLKSLHIVTRKFECQICQKTCEKPEHLECHQWWSSPNDDD